MPVAAAPVVLTAAVVAAVAFLNERDRKKITETRPVEPPQPPPPPPPPPVVEPVPVEITDFPPDALLGVVGVDARLRAGPSTASATKASLARGTIVQLFSGGHAPASSGAPDGWERVRTRSGVEGFLAAHLLAAPGGGAGPRETPAIEPVGPIGPVGPPLETIPQGPDTTATETEVEEPGILDRLGEFFGTSGYGYGYRRRRYRRPVFWSRGQIRAARMVQARRAAMLRDAILRQRAAYGYPVRRAR